MTNNRPAGQIVTGIVGTPTSCRERELIERVTLLENYAFDLQEANDRLEQQLNQATRPLLGFLMLSSACT
jgi:hypothetical protein